MVQAGVDRSTGNTEHFGDVCHGQVVIVAQDDWEAMFVIKEADGLPECGIHFVLHRFSLRVGLFVPEQTLQHLLQAPTTFITPEPVAAHIDGDAEQPGLERGVATKGLEGAQGGQEHVLRGIVGFVGVIQDGERQPVDISLIGLYQAFDCQRISLPALFEPMAVHDGHSTGLDRGQAKNLHLSGLLR